MAAAVVVVVVALLLPLLLLLLCRVANENVKWAMYHRHVPQAEGWKRPTGAGLPSDALLGLLPRRCPPMSTERGVGVGVGAAGHVRCGRPNAALGEGQGGTPFAGGSARTWPCGPSAAGAR